MQHCDKSWAETKINQATEDCTAIQTTVSLNLNIIFLLLFNSICLYKKKTTSINILISKEKDICEFRANHMFNL